MPKVEQEISEIRKYFVTWITEVKLATALDYFDINRISEGTAQRLLNMVYGYQLQDLNKEKKNFPGIDLGDRNIGIAFQITSRKDATKITESLKIFASNNFSKDFSTGLRFFIVNNGKRPSIKSNILDEYKSIFNIKKDILFPEDLIKLIENLYYTDSERFVVVKQFLKEEFGKPNQHSSILRFSDQQDKLEFYRRLLITNHKQLSNRFVPFVCRAGEEYVPTDQLPGKFLTGSGILLIGPSGCGKSILARKIALAFLNNGLPVLLEAKYYETDLNALFEKEIKAYGFNNGIDFFSTAKESQQKPLLIIDGLNECSTEARPKLLLELEYVMKTYDVFVLITTQELYEGIDVFDLTPISVIYPALATKKAIAINYGGNKNSNKLTPLLQVVSTSFEAKMIGEIAFDAIEKVSRFTIFEIFIKSKLADFRSEGFVLLSNIARVLSDKITFNLSERAVEELLRSGQLTEGCYKKCLSAGLLEYNDGKVSFSHEMFFKFFVADSIVRSAANADEINAKINAPKNYDKKLLIIGSIEDTDTLEKVLSNLTDSKLLASLYAGDGGDYCRLWIDQRLRDLLGKIKAEILRLEFEFGENTLNGIQFKPESLWNWTSQELALINALPIILIRNQYLKEVFELVGLMDDQYSIAVEKLFDAAKKKKINARSAIFSTTYIGFSIYEAAITKMFSAMNSAFSPNVSEIKDDSIHQLLKNKSLKHGQFYFLLLLLRYNDKLQQLYPYVQSILKNWRSVPYHLLLEVLQQISHYYKTEEQRKGLTMLLESIHSETQNIWLSTSLFDALGDLGALSNDAVNYESTVSTEIIEILAHPNDNEFWDRAAGAFYAQFDHPYDVAYYTVINRLTEQDKATFFQMALQGYHSSLFTIGLITESWKHLRGDIAPYLIRWTEIPIINRSFPQDSLTLFFLSHLLMAKSNYPLDSRYITEVDDKTRSLFAAAEVYYWLNKMDGDPDQNKQQAKTAAAVLFDLDNAYVIDSLWQLQECMIRFNTHQLTPESIIAIDLTFPAQVVAASRSALINLEWQKDVFGFPRNEEEVNLHAIEFLKFHGSIIDLDVLKPLTDNPLYGEAAVLAIKKLSS